MLKVEFTPLELAQMELKEAAKTLAMLHRIYSQRPEENVLFYDICTLNANIKKARELLAEQQGGENA